MKILHPDSLQWVGGEELRERQRQTGEQGAGKFVDCRPDMNDPSIAQIASRAMCLATPYAACLSCRHHRFELIFEQPAADWVLCPRWEGESGTGPTDYYVPVWLSECCAKPHQFCSQCPGREELNEMDTDKQKEGWLERYRKMTREV